MTARGVVRIRKGGIIITDIQGWLEAYCDGLDGVVEGIVILEAAGQLRPLARYARPGVPASEEIYRAAQSAVQSGQPVVQAVSSPATSRRQLVSLPLWREDTILGAVALSSIGANPNTASDLTESLRKACPVLSAMLAPSRETDVSVDASIALELQAAVLSRRRFDEAAATFVTRLTQLFGFERACIGFVDDGYATVVAISHGAAVDAQQELTREVAAAMDEAIDQARTICHPAAASGRPSVALCHAALARRRGGSACSIPIVDLGAIVGAVTVELGDRPIGQREIVSCEHLVSLVGPVLALKRESERSWRARARRTLREAWSRLTGPEELSLKLGVAAVAAFFGLLILVPVPYHVTAPVRLEGSVQRALVAASDGFVQQVSVRPGDAVKEGQILAELAQHDLQLERSKWESELAQQVNAYGAALARADRSLLMVNHAKAAEARAQLDLVEKQIERAQIRAPFDGFVISGDLSQSLGAPIKRGEALMVIAPHDRYRLIMEVDERDIADIKTGAAGRISLAALPAQAFSFAVERVTPLAGTREGRHFFEVEGKLDASATALRPGLQGIARIEADARPLVSRLFGRLLLWLRFSLWSWGWL
jgi:hypothetical protein